MIRDSRKGLAAVLLRLASMRNAWQGVAPLHAIPVSWDELSQAVCLSRSKVADLLSEFSRNGFIKTLHRRIEILDARGLERQLHK